MTAGQVAPPRQVTGAPHTANLGPMAHTAAVARVHLP
jgi:hypothetical protein